MGPLSAQGRENGGVKTENPANLGYCLMLAWLNKAGSMSTGPGLLPPLIPARLQEQPGAEAFGNAPWPPDGRRAWPILSADGLQRRPGSNHGSGLPPGGDDGIIGSDGGGVVVAQHGDPRGGNVRSEGRPPTPGRSAGAGRCGNATPDRQLESGCEKPSNMPVIRTCAQGRRQEYREPQ